MSMNTEATGETASGPTSPNTPALQHRVEALEGRIAKLVAAIENIPKMLTSTQGIAKLLELAQGSAPASNTVLSPAEEAQAQLQAQTQSQASVPGQPVMVQNGTQEAVAPQAPTGVDPQQILQQAMAAMSQGQQQGGMPDNGGGGMAGGGFLTQLLQLVKVGRELGLIGGAQQAGPSREDAQNDAFSSLVRTFEIVHQLETLTIDRMRATRLMLGAVSGHEDAQEDAREENRGTTRGTNRTRRATTPSSRATRPARR